MPRCTGVEALTDCTLCVFPSDGLWTLFREHPRLGYDITWLSAHEEGHVDDHLLHGRRRNATERVAMLLMHLYRRMERIGLVEGGSVAFPLNQQHIADALGLVAGAHQQDAAAPVGPGSARSSKTGGCACSTPGRWRALPSITTGHPAAAPAVARCSDAAA